MRSETQRAHNLHEAWCRRKAKDAAEIVRRAVLAAGDEVLGGPPLTPGRQVVGFEGYIQVPASAARLRWHLTTRAHRWWGPVRIETPLTTAS